MNENAPAFPYFIPVDSRSLSDKERMILECILEKEKLEDTYDKDKLKVVGRCGCGECPTVFFQVYMQSDKEKEVASYSGKDTSGGIVGVVLSEKNGILSQLEFYSADGHEPWTIPEAKTLEPI